MTACNVSYTKYRKQFIQVQYHKDSVRVKKQILSYTMIWRILHLMKVTAILPDKLIKEVQTHSGGKKITESINLALTELLQGCKNKKEKGLILEYWENLADEERNFGIIDGGILSFQKNDYSKGIGLTDAVLIHETSRRNSKIWTLDTKILSHIPKVEQFSD